MNHDMLDLCELGFDGGVYLLRNGVALSQRDLTVCGNLNIHINPVSEDTGMKQVDAQHSGRRRSALPQGFLHLGITGVVNHFFHGILENIKAAFRTLTGR